MEQQYDNPFQFTKAVILLPLFFVLTLWLIFWYELHFQQSLSHFGPKWPPKLLPLNSRRNEQGGIGPLFYVLFPHTNLPLPRIFL
jgi:hypothetical protein